jgi:hypothetical protein
MGVEFDLDAHRFSIESLSRRHHAHRVSTTGAGWQKTRSDHVTRGGAITIIWLIVVERANSVGNRVRLDATDESRNPERLIQRTDGVGGVQQFGVDRNNDAAQAHDYAQDADRQDEDQFGGNDQSAFVIHQFLKHV